jgi:TonB-dependent Receptor Plug Domain/CarboxypepD_reg-like domain
MYKTCKNIEQIGRVYGFIRRGAFQSLLNQFFTMPSRCLAGCLMCLFAGMLSAQRPVLLSGYVEDATSGERLIGASLFCKQNRAGTSTNIYGYFSFNVPADADSIVVRYVGYSPLTTPLNVLIREQNIRIRLSPSNELRTVEINQSQPEQLAQMGRIDVPVAQIKRMPMLLGEADVMKTLQFLPGVKAGTEGTSGIYVRGGGPDQNLILLDGVPIYNPAHIGGFFSVFNTDAIRNVTLINGGFPARYGGRLSSVVEVTMKEGDRNAYHTEASIGLLTSKIVTEGPIKKGKSSFMVAGRRTYFDVLLAGVFSENSENNGTVQKRRQRLNFHDLNAKLNWSLNAKNQLFLSIYNGFDIYKETESSSNPQGSSGFETGFDYGNTLAALRWNWIPDNNRVFVNTIASYTNYNYEFADRYTQRTSPKPEEANGVVFRSAISDWSLKTNVDYYWNTQHSLRFGGGLLAHRFRPSESLLSATGQRDTVLSSGRYGGVEWYGYIEDDLQFGNFKANIGLHTGFFSIRNRTFASLQPRLNLNYLLSGGMAVRASYSHMAQFVHLLTNDALGLPTDSWVPAVPGRGPQQARQVALGIAKTRSNGIGISVEAYYKTMRNMLAYREGSGFLTQDPQWERKVTQGTGRAYGIEWLVQKKSGRLSGWASYTLAWNSRLFQEINNGKRYPYKFDRRHEFALVGTYQLSKKIALSGNWSFATGNAITIPVQVYSFFIPVEDDFFAPSRQYLYSDRNDFRTKTIHRLDGGIEFYKRKRRFERKWMLGVYNMYNRANPFYFFVRNTFNTVQVVQANLIPVLPYVAYSIKF